MTAARSDLMQTSGGEFVPADRRTVIARAILAVLQNQNGIETLDWQIADAVLAASQPDREAVQTLQKFADLFRSGAHGCDMGCDAAKSLALAIDSLLSGEHKNEADSNRTND